MTPLPARARQIGPSQFMAIAETAVAIVMMALCFPSVSYGQVTFEVLKGFEAPFFTGGSPYAGLIQSSDGRFYGTTRYGRASGRGTIFRLDSSGTLTTLTLTLKPMGLKSITLSPDSVVGGSPASGAVRLECAAGPDPIVVTLSSSKPATAWPTSETVAIPVGVATAPFSLTTVPVAAVVKAAIKASANGVTKSKTLTVKSASSP